MLVPFNSIKGYCHKNKDSSLILNISYKADSFSISSASEFNNNKTLSRLLTQESKVQN